LRDKPVAAAPENFEKLSFHRPRALAGNKSRDMVEPWRWRSLGRLFELGGAVFAEHHYSSTVSSLRAVKYARNWARNCALLLARLKTPLASWTISACGS
jgi:hypothetical protein